MKGEGPCKTVRVGPAATISLFIGKLFPDVQLNFPVQLCRELLGKRLNLVDDLDACIAAERRIVEIPCYQGICAETGSTVTVPPPMISTT